jgi:hypothetical protein
MIKCNYVQDPQWMTRYFVAFRVLHNIWSYQDPAADGMAFRHPHNECLWGAMDVPILDTAHNSSFQLKVKVPAHKRPLKYSSCVISSRDLVASTTLSTIAYCEMTPTVLYAQDSVKLDRAKSRYMKHRHPSITMAQPGETARCAAQLRQNPHGPWRCSRYISCG